MSRAPPGIGGPAVLKGSNHLLVPSTSHRVKKPTKMGAMETLVLVEMTGMAVVIMIIVAPSMGQVMVIISAAGVRVLRQKTQ